MCPEMPVIPSPGMTPLASATENQSVAALLTHYQMILNSTSDLISMVDRDFRYLFVNQTYLDLYDRPLEQILGKRVAEVWGEQKFEQFIRPNFDKAFMGYTVRDQSWIQCGRRGDRFMDVLYQPYRFGQGGIEAVLVFSRDTTPLKEAESRLQQADSNLDNLAQFSADYILQMDISGNISYLNPAAARIFRLHDNILAYIHPEDLEASRTAWEMLRHGKQLDSFENRIRDNSRRTHYLAWNAVPLRNAKGAIIGISAIFRDVTQRNALGVIVENAGLTTREAQVLQLVLDGFTNLNIAARLRIEESTVKFHLNSIFKKTRVGSRAELISMLHRED